MSKTNRIPYLLFVCGLGTAAWLLLNWSSEPRPLSADTPTAPEVSVVFLLDSSPNMLPWDGYDYFEMAKDGILSVVQNEGLTAGGTYEIGIMQYCEPGSPGYVMGQQPAEGLQTGTVHWFPPLRISDEDDRTQLIAWIQDLEPCMHFTRGLIDMGIQSASNVLAARQANHKQIVYIGTGEYRLPQRCPTAAYSIQPCNDSNSSYDLHGGGGSFRPCNRVCEARHFVAANAPQVSFSAVHVGPQWNNYHPATGIAVESATPYGPEPDYCAAVPIAAEYQPNRSGFLQELARWNHNASAPCDGYFGRYARVEAAVSMAATGLVAMTQAEVEERIVGDITTTVRKWLCLWNPDDDNDGDTVANMCDNCPATANPRQRDCNRDGVGDLCQRDPADCGSNSGATDDDDLDGLCNGLDTCPGGDDCLIRYWLTNDPTSTCDEPEVGEPLDLSTCGCDCDGTNGKDLCQMAQAHRLDTLPPEQAEFDPLDPDFALEFDSPPDGVPDCAQGSTPDCHPRPEACDFGALEDGEHLTLLGDCGGQSAAECLDLKGWTWDGSAAALSISSQSYTRPCNPPNAQTPCPVISGQLRIVPGESSTGSQLIGPKLVFPEHEVCRACGLTGTTQNDEKCPTIGDWTFVAIEADIMLEAPFAAGNKWHVVVKDACDSESQIENVHIVLEPVDQYYKLRAVQAALDINCSGTGPYLCDVSNFTPGSWMTLRIGLNRTAYRTIASIPPDTTDCSPRSPLVSPKARAVSLARCQNDSPDPKTFFETNGYDPELPLPAFRGMQLSLYPEGENPVPLRIGMFRLYSASGCDFWRPCAASCESCTCSDEPDRTWACDSAGGCSQ